MASPTQTRTDNDSQSRPDAPFGSRQPRGDDAATSYSGALKRRHHRQQAAAPRNRSSRNNDAPPDVRQRSALDGGDQRSHNLERHRRSNVPISRGLLLICGGALSSGFGRRIRLTVDRSWAASLVGSVAPVVGAPTLVSDGFETSKTLPVTPTREPRCDTTGLDTRSTGTPPLSSLPSSQHQPSERQADNDVGQSRTMRARFRARPALPNAGCCVRRSALPSSKPTIVNRVQRRPVLAVVAARYRSGR